MTFTSSQHASQWLPPIAGLHRRDPEHRYYLHDQLLPVSVTGVLAFCKSAYAMERIEATRETWEPRGNTCHRALELFLSLPNQCPGDLTADLGLGTMEALQELLTGDYADWVRPLVTHDRWSAVTVIASERATCCPRRGVGGTYDLGYLDPSLPPSPARPRGVEGPARVLADLKSLGENGASYSTAAQLGGYMACERSQGYWWDYGQTIWARPGKTTFSTLYSHDECRLAWAAAWAIYLALRPTVANA